MDYQHDETSEDASGSKDQPDDTKEPRTRSTLEKSRAIHLGQHEQEKAQSRQPKSLRASLGGLPFPVWLRVFLRGRPRLAS